MGRCGGDVGRCGETWGDVGDAGEVWGDMGRRGEMWGDVAALCSANLSSADGRNPAALPRAVPALSALPSDSAHSFAGFWVWSVQCVCVCVHGRCRQLARNFVCIKFETKKESKQTTQGHKI